MVSIICEAWYRILPWQFCNFICEIINQRWNCHLYGINTKIPYWSDDVSIPRSEWWFWFAEANFPFSMTILLALPKSGYWNMTCMDLHSSLISVKIHFTGKLVVALQIVSCPLRDPNNTMSFFTPNIKYLSSWQNVHGWFFQPFSWWTGTLLCLSAVASQTHISYFWQLT